jgi:hypothetical protein
LKGFCSKSRFLRTRLTIEEPFYSFSDAAARIGKYSYRLKQIDRDGKFEHHQAVEVTLGITPNTVWLDNNYPNPFNPSTKISFVLGTTGNASLKIFDLLGKEVVTLADGVFIAGEVQAFTFDASKYSSGIYYYQLKSGTQTAIKKMLPSDHVRLTLKVSRTFPSPLMKRRASVNRGGFSLWCRPVQRFRSPALVIRQLSLAYLSRRLMCLPKGVLWTGTVN